MIRMCHLHKCVCVLKSNHQQSRQSHCRRSSAFWRSSDGFAFTRPSALQLWYPVASCYSISSEEKYAIRMRMGMECTGAQNDAWAVHKTTANSFIAHDWVPYKTSFDNWWLQSTVAIANWLKNSVHNKWLRLRFCSQAINRREKKNNETRFAIVCFDHFVHINCGGFFQRRGSCHHHLHFIIH